MSKSAGRQT